ncbi:MAG: hypothetical protein ABSC55_17470 [Syntrophorhabdales bacterium]
MKSLKMILLLGLLAVVLCAAGVASAQTYPTKPIHVIVGFGPGGGRRLCSSLYVGLL